MQFVDDIILVDKMIVWVNAKLELLGKILEIDQARDNDDDKADL